MNGPGSNLVGGWHVMWGQPKGMDRLDVSLEGFWRSFGAVVFVVPSLVIAILLQRSTLAGSGEPVAQLAPADLSANAVGLLLDWITFPILFALLAKPLGVAAGYVPFIVARNWAAVSVAAIGTLLNAVGALPFAPVALTSALLVMALGLTLWFSYNVARTALRAPIGLAIPIVVLDFLLSFTIWSLVAPLAQGAA
jgi:hypothetical protein